MGDRREPAGVGADDGLPKAVDELMAGRPITVPIASLRPSDSPRSGGEDTEHVRTLAECDSSLPPITVHRATMRVVDGMHRLQAASLRGETEIEVRFFDGDERDAFVVAVRENTVHGLPLRLSDRRSAASRIIGTHPHWSDRAIGATTGLAANTVGALRRSTAQDERLTVRVGRDGRMRPVDGAQGRLRVRDILTEQPGTPVREAARAAGVSIRTARDVRDRMARGEDPLPASQRERQRPDRDRTVLQQSHRDLLSLLGKLKRDPSIRFNEGGRTLVRLLDMDLALEPEQLEQLLARVPVHCSQAVVALARGCAQRWHAVAAIVEAIQIESMSGTGDACAAR